MELFHFIEVKILLGEVLTEEMEEKEEILYLKLIAICLLLLNLKTRTNFSPKMDKMDHPKKVVAKVEKILLVIVVIVFLAGL